MLLDTFLWKKMVFALTKEALFPKWVMTDIVGHMVLVVSTQFWKKMGSSLLFLPSLCFHWDIADCTLCCPLLSPHDAKSREMAIRRNKAAERLCDVNTFAPMWSNHCTDFWVTLIHNAQAEEVLVSFCLD